MSPPGPFRTASWETWLDSNGAFRARGNITNFMLIKLLLFEPSNAFARGNEKWVVFAYVLYLIQLGTSLVATYYFERNSTIQSFGFTL